MNPGWFDMTRPSWSATADLLRSIVEAGFLPPLVGARLPRYGHPPLHACGAVVHAIRWDEENRCALVDTSGLMTTGKVGRRLTLEDLW